MADERAATLDQQIGGRIRVRRHQLGMSQAALGEVLGVSFQQVQKYERGTNRVSASSLVTIAQALRCRPADLLGVEDAESDLDWRLIHDRSAIEMLEAFSAIQSPQQRRAVLAYVRSLAKAGAAGD